MTACETRAIRPALILSDVVGGFAEAPLLGSHYKENKTTSKINPFPYLMKNTKIGIWIKTTKTEIETVEDIFVS